LSSQKGSEDSKSEKAQQRAVVINAKSKKNKKPALKRHNPIQKKKKREKQRESFTNAQLKASVYPDFSPLLL
jgi:hypothetical protein